MYVYGNLYGAFHEPLNESIESLRTMTKPGIAARCTVS